MISAIGKNDKRGFSLLEFLLVITILATIFSLSIPLFKNNFNNLQLNNSTQDLVFLMRYLHSSAVMQNKTLCLNFDAQERKISPVSKNKSEFMIFNDRFAKIYQMPKDIYFESNCLYACFYPDGSADKLNLFIKKDDKNVFKIETISMSGDVKISKIN